MQQRQDLFIGKCIVRCDTIACTCVHMQVLVSVWNISKCYNRKHRSRMYDAHALQCPVSVRLERRSGTTRTGVHQYMNSKSHFVSRLDY